MYRRILIPTDGSQNAARAAERGLDIAEDYDADVYALAVVETTRTGEPALSTMELLVDQVEDQCQALLSDIQQRADERGIPIKSCCCHGEPAAEIISFADEVDADLIVMGYQGETHRHHLGSVTRRVRRDCDRELMIVR
ncbi:universal stress protein [Natronomonas sp. EA1]|uniref:universal stress protein n=1 Tax=Natronomonas sp. EA1 TaxID=3421655 RepID=UPI003EB97D49